MREVNRIIAIGFDTGRGRVLGADLWEGDEETLACLPITGDCRVRHRGFADDRDLPLTCVLMYLETINLFGNFGSEALGTI